MNIKFFNIYFICIIFQYSEYGNDTYIINLYIAATTSNPQGTPNLHIWRSETGELVKSFIQKKQSDW